MARRSYSATSYYRTKTRLNPLNTVLCTLVSFLSLLPSAAEAGLYTASDQIVILSPENVNTVLFNSTAALLVEFYATWCGHCIAFSSVWKSLARDIKEWKPAIDLAAIDCAKENNRKVCTSFGITGYPSLKFFPAFSSSESMGEDLRGFPRDVRGLRHHIIEKLETHNEDWPPACPPLETASKAEIDSFFQTNNVKHLALVFESKNSYVGREVTLDMLQYENITVRRVLNTEESLVSWFGVTDFPSCYLYDSSGSISRLKVLKEARTFYSYALQRLPGVVRTSKPLIPITDLIKNFTQEEWRPFNKTRVYMSDLESAIHYSLRVELAAHTSISGDDLTALKKYISVLAKHFPGRPSVKSTLKTMDIWLREQEGTEIKYSDFRNMLDNTVQTSDAVLPEGVRWVGCQGSQARYRGYPCAMWTLFHVLTVEAKGTGGSVSDPQEVLQAMRGYVSSFFGCRPCATHFESMAKESLNHVTSLSAAVLWLWTRHNRVNNRLAGDLSEDPHFPKIQWPSPDLCPSCHGVKRNGEHTWNQDVVLAFLQNYFSPDRILQDYLQDETQALIQQRNQLTAARMEKEAGRGMERRAREVPENRSATPAEEPQEDEQEEEEEEEEEQAGEPYPTEFEGMGAAGESKAVAQPPQSQHKPKIVGMKLREPQEDIIDLDSFVNQHYKAKALQAAAMSGIVRRRSLQKQDDVEDLQFERGWRVKRDLGSQEENLGGGLEPYLRPQSKRWMSLLSMGFSRLDVSLCVLLYLLSAMCLLSMYLYFKLRIKLRRAKVSLP
ncbi:sulfhydryl oxidase 1-like [Myxocyprinus asiaticus]|uniref:sulfhydryl oxidase 1-like n=1 Tax=Myxocyprinus asiaticus TaxID=70543 RepID=UPI002223735B|nr:sulfhydryl oxidase 1-like [Myxocyprinus asiaticus]